MSNEFLDPADKIVRAIRAAATNIGVVIALNGLAIVIVLTIMHHG